jgi:hypothetical protein
MGFTRKALFIATFGLSGLVFKDNSKKERPAQAAQRRVRTKGQTKVTALKPPAARRREPQAARRPRTQAAQRPKPQAARRPRTQAARRPKTQAQRASTVSQAAGAGSGTASELERITELHGRGALTGEEFAAAKAKILGTSPTPDASGGRSVKFPAVEANVAAARRLADMAVPDGGGSVATVGSD